MMAQGARSPPFRQRDTLVQDYLGREGAEQFLSDWDEERSSRSSSLVSMLSLSRGDDGGACADRASTQPEHPTSPPPRPPPPVSNVDTRRSGSTSTPRPAAAAEEKVCLAQLAGARARDGGGGSGAPTTATPAETAVRNRAGLLFGHEGRASATSLQNYHGLGSCSCWSGGYEHHHYPCKQQRGVKACRQSSEDFRGPRPCRTDLAVEGGGKRSAVDDSACVSSPRSSSGSIPFSVTVAATEPARAGSRRVTSRALVRSSSAASGQSAENNSIETGSSIRRSRAVDRPRAGETDSSTGPVTVASRTRASLEENEGTDRLPSLLDLADRGIDDI